MEFIDIEMLIILFLLSGLLLFLVVTYLYKYNESNNSFSKYINFAYLIIIISPILLVVYNKNLLLENIKVIEEGGELKCMDNKSLYLVSKKNSWSIDGIYFTKDSLLIKIDRCSKRD